MSQRTVVGMTPWLPWPFSRWAWWTEPVPAERLAALRIGTGAVLMLDVLGFYLPYTSDLFGRGSLGEGDVFSDLLSVTRWPWSALAGVDSPGAWQMVLLTWAAAGLLLLVGFWPRLAAAVAWFISGTVLYANPFVYNGGDIVRSILLFFLMLSPCGAVWSIAAQRNTAPGPVCVPAWPLRLLFVQLLVIYFVSGASKLGPQWQAGTALYYLSSDMTLMRWSRGDLTPPDSVLQLLAWSTVAWELTFPIFVCWPRTRYLALGVGVVFHVMTGVAVKLGPFPLYMLCLYLPLLPWERWFRSAPKAVETAVD